MCTHDDSGVVAANGDVLRPGRRREAEDEDEHGHNEQHPRHDDGFPLPLLEGAWKTTKQLRRFPPSQALEEDGGSWVDWSLFASLTTVRLQWRCYTLACFMTFSSKEYLHSCLAGIFKYRWKSQRSKAQNTNTLVRSKSEKAHVKEITMDSTPARREKKNKAAFLHQKYFLYYFYSSMWFGWMEKFPDIMQRFAWFQGLKPFPLWLHLKPHHMPPKNNCHDT